MECAEVREHIEKRVLKTIILGRKTVQVDGAEGEDLEVRWTRY